MGWVGSAYVELSENEEDEVQFEGGIFVDIFKELSQLLNFSYTLTTPLDVDYGTLKSDGTWSGMIGQLVKKDVDIGRFHNSIFNTVIKHVP